MKVVIIGGVAGGASAAARLRRLDEKAEITIYEKSGFVSYANCGLPYFIGDVIEEESNLTLQTPNSFKTRFNIDVKTNHEVLSIDRNNKTVKVKDLESGNEFDDNYDKLIIAVGAKPIKPNIEGIDLEKIYTLRNVEDTKKIKESIKRKNIKNVAIVGGGFIGIELAENLKHLKKDVTIIDKANQVLGQLDEDMVSFVHKELIDNGIKLMLGRGVSSFKEEDNKITINLDTNESLRVDAVVLAIGVMPDSKLAKESGLKLGVKDSILVDETMRTSDPNIYAVGDVVSIPNVITNELTTISLAGPANKEGRIAANNVAGLRSSYKGSLGTNILKVFEMAVASVGINEKTIKLNKYNYQKIIISPANHASYYPGGKVMTIKALYEKDSERILGAQIVGYQGVDKRIDIIATAMWAGLKISDLKDLDLAYAPPFGSAKDPINMLGFVADNVEHGIVKHFYVEDIEALNKRDDVILLDTRTVNEYSKGHAQGFELNIPVDELRERINELDKTKKIYVMCQSGLRSYIATRILKANGYNCYNFAGGYRYYSTVINNEFIKNCNTDCGI